MPTLQPILLVGKEKNDVLFMTMALETTGITNKLEVAVDGRQALEYLKGVNHYADRRLHPLPCLVLLDLKLPYVPGLEVLKKIRQDPALSQIIVIVLTSSHEQSDI